MIYSSAILSLFLLILSLNEMKIDASTPLVKKKIVVIGGGIHGVSLAYYLTKTYASQVDVTVIEKTKIAAAASGKAGGFLARDWGSGPTSQLHKVSYELHKTLASTLGVSSYREVTTLNVQRSRKKVKSPASWLNINTVSGELMDKNTAQVTPLELTEKMMEAAIASGAKLRIDSAIGVHLNENGAVASVDLGSGASIATDQLAICLGPWSGVMVEDWFNLPLPMEGVKSTSLVYDNLAEVKQEPFALFCGEDENGCHLELYPRVNGELYICGCGGSDYVSGDRLRADGDCESADKVHQDPARVQAAARSFETITQFTSLNGQKPVPAIQQACMRPCMPDALPVMGKVPGVEGAYISCGHNCWGILWGPVSGLSMAELMMEGRSRSVDLSSFDPSRYMSQSAGKRGRKKGLSEVGEQW
mmetsp:Transcript_18641/g.25711  ORF Transcript_18641/g.25711 Transcript_18641/m.25711 type:complete len:418 (+) Transcript_18641:3-1256(+)